MVNSRELRKKSRMEHIMRILETLSKEDKALDKDKLIASLMINHSVSRRLALEEIDAAIAWMGLEMKTFDLDKMTNGISYEEREAINRLKDKQD